MLRIELPLSISFPTVNAYLILEPVPTLIDCGLNTPESRECLAAGLQAAGLQPADIRRVFVTHPHVDHIGLAGALAENGAEIWMSDLTGEWMSDLDTQRAGQIELLLSVLSTHGFDRETLERTTAFYNSMGSMFSTIPSAGTRLFKTGESVDLDGRAWQVLPAPGHTNRQVCFYQPEAQALFSADMLLPKAPVPMIEGRLGAPSERSPGLPALLDSYQRFRDLEVRQVLPGHGEPIANHRGLIEKQLDRIHIRKTECLHLISSGVERLPELLVALYRNLSPSDRLGGLAMLIGYIDLLIAENRVRVVTEGDERRYKPGRPSAAG